jgi:hypothetical protein
MIAKEIEAIFAGQDLDGGAVDTEGVLKAIERLNAIATKADLPTLIAAIQSPRNNFWTRELLAAPISKLGGSDYLETLLDAAQISLDEAHDNDSFDTYLEGIAYVEPERCQLKLEGLLARPGFRHGEAARWLLKMGETEREQ